jgi:hypothetical protein
MPKLRSSLVKSISKVLSSSLDVYALKMVG